MNNSQHNDSPEGIAIIGMAGRFPSARSVEKFWQNLKDGVEAISFFTDEEVLAEGIDRAVLNQPDYVKAKGALEDIEMFDASFFGCSAKEAEVMDPQHRVFLECAWEALENAGYDSERYPGAVSLFAGTSLNTYLMLNLLSNPDVIDLAGFLQTSIRNRTDHLTTRVAYKLNLNGPAVTVQTACSTSLVAAHLACQSLLNYECDMAMAGGVTISVPNKSGYVYQEGGIFSADGHCRAFDAKASGTVSGNGAGIVVLKRLADALADGDCIRAVIKGSAINNDGAVKVGYTAPSVDGQSEVVALAQAVAEVDSDTISYIEAHGTGTALGDPIEMAALKQVFHRSGGRKNFCGIGSVKSNIGHLDVAAGVAGLIKTTLALEHRLLPASLHYREPNPQVDFADSPFYVVDKLSEWKTDALPRRAGVSSFGIGGTNAHVVLEESPPAGRGGKSRRRQLLLISAKTSSALEAATSRLREYLENNPQTDLADVAYTLQIGRREFEQRRMLVCQDAADAVSALELLDPRRVVPGLQEPKPRPVAFLFPGQGAQYVEMGRELYESEAVFRTQVDRCCDYLAAHLGCDLREVIFPSQGRSAESEERLKQTQVTQAALFVIEYALAKLWMQWGVNPQAMIGHSIGEYVAACLAGVFSLEDALTLVAARGKLMQSVPRGSMVVVPRTEKEVRPLLNGGLVIAAVNAPALCVVAGPPEEVEKLVTRLAGQEIVCRPLHTSHAFHSAMMEPVMEALTAEVEKIELRAPTIPFISNLTATWMTARDATDPAYWAKHLRHTVRFSDGVAQLFKEPDTMLLEVGPGRTLMTITRWHPQKAAGQTVLTSLPHPGERGADLEHMLNALGRLWLAGAQVNWEGFYAEEKRRRTPLPTYPFERRRYWIEPAMNILSGHARQPALTPKTNISDWFYVPTWKRSISPIFGEGTAPTEQASSFLVFADECGIGGRLAARLKESGRQVVTVFAGRKFARNSDQSFTVRPRHKEDHDSLLRALSEHGQRPGHILHLWNITLNEAPAETAFHEEIQDLGFYSLLALAQTLGELDEAEALQLDVITNNMQKVTGNERLFPEKATVLGPCKVIPQEYRHITCRSIDVELPEAHGRQRNLLIEQLLAEALVPSSDPVIAYRGGHRWIQGFDPIRLENGVGATTPLRSGGIYLITGGMGGIGLALAEHLARLTRAKLVLVGRSGLPQREAWEAWLSTAPENDTVSRQIRKIREIEELGAEVLTLQANVADEKEMRRVLELVHEKFGAINGIVHAAGVPGGGMIQLKTVEQAAEVLAPKVKGARILDELFKNEPLDFLALCSSRSAILGGFGQVDYCAANAFLDAFAFDYASRHQRLAVSINWDGWQEVGMLVKAAARYDGAAFTRPIRAETGHPLLEFQVVDSEQLETYETEFSVKKKWILDEHRIGGNAVLPGVTYLEMARAAFEKHALDGTIELQDVFFLTPMGIKEGETRVVRFTMEKNGAGYKFAASSRSSTDDSPNPTWHQHAIGNVKRAGTRHDAQHDLRELRRRCNIREDLVNADESDPDLGPRWQNIQKIYVGQGEILVLFDLAEEFAGDLKALKLHPALLDRAAGTGMNYLELDGIYLPLSYKRLVFRQPLPRKIYAHIKVKETGDASKETVSFDVLIMDEDGVELVVIDEFSEKRINDLTGQVKALMYDIPVGGAANGNADGGVSVQDLYQQSINAGILPGDGVDIFIRILTHNPFPQVIVSTKDLQASIKRANTLGRSLASDGIEKLRGARPQHRLRTLETDYIAPRNEAEQILAGLLQEMLGIDQVGIHDNFFDLGGDSVLSIQLIARAKQAGINLTPQQIFRYQTVAELVEVAGQRPEKDVLMERIERGGELPLSFAQQRFWFLDQMEAGGAGYSIPEALRLRGALRVTVLRTALTEIIRRHEVLRSRLINNDGNPQLVLGPTVEIPLPIVDLSALPAATRETEAARLARAEAERPFDLASDLLLRVTLLRLDRREHIGLFTIHHIASDAWSLGVLMHELSLLYGAFHRGEPSPLPELPLQYSDYAAWQRQVVSGQLLEEQLAYWRRQLGGKLPVLELPADHERPAVRSTRGQRRRFTLRAELAEALRALSQREGVTLFMTLLATFQALLYRLSKETDVLVGAAVAGRNRAETAGLIGLFVNTLVLRSNLSDQPRFRELLARVRETCLDAYAHQDVPFERVVEHLQPERRTDHTSVFQITFGLRNTMLGEAQLPGVEMTPEDYGVETVRLDVGLWIEENGGRLSGIWNYRTDLYKEERVDEWTRQYERLLEAVVADPNERVSRLALETEEDVNRKRMAEREWEEAATNRLLTRHRKPLNLDAD